MFSIVAAEVTPFVQNCRLLFNHELGSGAIVDPGGDVPMLVEMAKVVGITDLQVILTHAHIDHAGGVEQFIGLWEAESGKRPPLLAHPGEKALRASVAQQAVLFGLPGHEYRNAPEPDRYIDDGEGVMIADKTARVLFTPGHSPGHVSLYFAAAEVRLGVWQPETRLAAGWNTVDAPVLIAGDTLFAGSIGRTDLPGGNHRTLLKSIRDKILTLPGETLVLPGHGPNTTVAREHRDNPFLQ